MHKISSLFVGIAIAAISTPSFADDVDLAKVRVKGVSNLKPVVFVVARPHEPQATYKVIALGNGPEGSVVSLNTRYSDASGWVYTVRAFKCESGQLKTLRSGETLDGMLKSKADPSWSPLVDGSSASQVAEIACRESGKRLSL